jgi:hypothetical protein
MIHPGSAQAGFDVAQAFPVGELSEGQAEELISAGESVDLVVSLIAFYTLAEFVRGKKGHQLGENGFSGIHRPSPFAVLREYGRAASPNSNRLIADYPKTHLAS